MSEEILFCYGEFATRGAAISILADELKPATGTTLNKGQREALATVMINTPTGNVETGPVVVHWRHGGERADGYRSSDLYYWID